MKKSEKRDSYKAIVQSNLNSATRKVVNRLFEDACKSEKVDEHGNWSFGADFDRKGRGYALNWDLYGVGRDYFSKKTMIVIQVRQYVKQRKNYFPQIRKAYFLIGRNEDNTTFAHPVSSRVIHSAIDSGRDVIRSCQNWIFGTDYTKLLRQGDIALVPIRAKVGLKLPENELLLQGSHRLQAIEIYGEGALYAKDPSLFHLPQTHPNLVELKGWFKVLVGKRGNFYDFATPTID